MKDEQSLNPVSKDKWYKRFLEYLLHEKKILDFNTKTAKCLNHIERLRFPDFYYVAMLIFPYPIFTLSIHILRFLVSFFNIPPIKYFDFIISIICEILLTYIILKLIRCVIFSICEWKKVNETYPPDETYKLDFFLQEKAKVFRRYCIISFVIDCALVITLL